MAINFTNNIDTYTQTATRSALAKHFAEFASKKALQASGILTDEQYAVVASITGTFNIAVHEGKRYVAVTIYRASSDPKYSFVIVDLQTKGVAPAASIKTAKAAILEQVAEDNASAAENAEKPDAQQEPADQEEPSEKPEEPAESGKKGKGRKNVNK